MEQKEKVHLAGLVGVLVIIAGLYCNSNNNPIPFMIRIIPPYQNGNSKLFYINIIMLIVISFILFEIYKVTKWRILNSVTKRLIGTFVFVIICGYISVGAVQLYKSFQSDLKCIYLDRTQMELNYKWKTVKTDGEIYKEYNGGAYVTLKNCSKKEEQRFKVKVLVDSELEPEVAQRLLESEELILHPGETQKMQVISLDGLKVKVNGDEALGSSGSSSRRGLKVILYNEDTSVAFLENE